MIKLLCCVAKGANVDVGNATNGFVVDPTATLANGKYAEFAAITGLKNADIGKTVNKAVPSVRVVIGTSRRCVI